MRRVLYNGCLLVCTIIFILTGGLLIRGFLHGKDEDAKKEEWIQTAGGSELPEADDVQTAESFPAAAFQEQGSDIYLLRHVDFMALRQRNPEVIAWIFIPDTPIDYPVLHHNSDVNWYLKHNADNQPDIEGAIFLPPEIELPDTHLILHGHNMRSGRMFGSLKKYKDGTYGKSHPYIYLYTPYHTFRAAVFASYTSRAGDDTFQYEHLLQTKDYSEWLEKLTARSDYPWDITPDASARCLTLSTCAGDGDPTGRYTIHAAILTQRNRQTADSH